MESIGSSSVVAASLSDFSVCAVYAFEPDTRHSISRKWRVFLEPPLRGSADTFPLMNALCE
jgi:hypothetical protein